MRNMEELFVHLLKDIYYAEKQLVKALPKMAKAAETPKLKQAFENHLAETEGQVERLEKVFDIVGKAARGEKCEAIVGLIAEGKEVIEDGEDRPSSMPVSLQQRRRSSTTKWPATEPW